VYWIYTLIVRPILTFAAYRLKCIGKINRTSIGKSVILSRMTEENPVLLAPCDKTEPTNVFERRFSVKFPSRSD
jgi:hypothetical protein